MVRTMRAAQYDKERREILVHNILVPEPGEDQLQIKVAAASFCHSDLMMSQRPDNFGRPITMGHEAVGVISKLHPSAEGKGFALGDKIGMLYIVDICFTCEGCQLHGTFCVNSKNGGPKIQGLQTDGFFAEYAIVHWRNAIHLPENLPIERMSPLFCAGITAFHAVDKCELEPGQWLAIIGCGGLGQMAIRYAKAMGLHVIGLDINDRMLTLAQKCGADATFNPSKQPDFYKEIRKLVKSRGCHAAAVFSDSSAAYITAQRALAFNGVLMVVGMPEKPHEFSPVALSLGLFRVKGASNGTPAEMKKVVDFTAKHQIIPEVEFRTLDEMPQIWDEMAQGKATKRMVVLFKDRTSKF